MSKPLNAIAVLAFIVAAAGSVVILDHNTAFARPLVIVSHLGGHNHQSANGGDANGGNGGSANGGNACIKADCSSS